MWMVFDVETVPDADAGRRQLNLDPSVPDSEVRSLMIQHRIQETGGSSFMKPAFHQVVAIAAALIDDNGSLRRLTALGDLHASEKELVSEFFRVIADARPRLVGWNTGGFDLPTLILRGMRHGVTARAFYQVGEPYHGYRKRFDEESHIDLMDVLSGYGATARLSLDEMASVLKVPGKLDVTGNDVLSLHEEGKIKDIRAYCELDVLTTSLIFARYAAHRGWFDEEQQGTFYHSVRQFLDQHADPHWQKFLSSWTHLNRGAYE